MTRAASAGGRQLPVTVCELQSANCRLRIRCADHHLLDAADGHALADHFRAFAGAEVHHGRKRGVDADVLLRPFTSGGRFGLSRAAFAASVASSTIPLSEASSNSRVDADPALLPSRT